jgi:hypothetical protein
MTPKPRFSIIKLNPGPDVAVIALTPAQEAPRMAFIDASSSSIWIKIPSTSGRRADIRSATSVAGVIGYPAKKRQPALIAPSAQAVSPFIKNSPTSGPTLGMALFPPNFLFLKRYHSNGKLRTDEFAQAAVNTIVTASGINRMIPFKIELCRFL